ncbi:hypothetical protein [Streptomyces sp. WMMB 322]|uniref:glycine-rich domain-containing protein n=1 Tax=Streptomyces sp. WMMB 322 TaxID=1286821 RepID=UPI0006E2213A|nr:hypothetical protein [Streptomyces sp. WMMB 322]SCK44504.1 hypothetical protein H180DRAFT_03928 [Streptomyces sp. WMMB 322]
MADVRALLTPDQFEDIAATVRDNNTGMSEGMAVRIVTEALKYVDAVTQFPTVRTAPSRVVDEGWHALILHTETYADLCARLGGFVHHHPERPDAERFDPDVLTRTVAVIEQSGHSVDQELWTGPTKALVDVAAKCSHTPVPGGCGPIQPMPKPKRA